MIYQKAILEKIESGANYDGIVYDQYLYFCLPGGKEIEVFDDQVFELFPFLGKTIEIRLKTSWAEETAFQDGNWHGAVTMRSEGGGYQFEGEELSLELIESIEGGTLAPAEKSHFEFGRLDLLGVRGV